MAMAASNLYRELALHLHAGDSTLDAAQSVAADELARRWSSEISCGSAAALSQLYEAWFDRLVTAVQARTGRDESFALDVVQEVMLKIAESIPSLDSHADLERWILRVCYTTAIDHMRSGQRRATRETCNVMKHGGHDPVTALAASEDHLQELQQALAQLGDPQRQLLILR